MSNLGHIIWKHTVRNPMSRCEIYRDPRYWVACRVLGTGKIEVSRHRSERNAEKAARRGMKVGPSKEVSMWVVMNPGKPAVNGPMKIRRKK